METDELSSQIDDILERIDKQPEADTPEEPVTDAQFAEPVEGEVLFDPPKPRGIAIKWLLPIVAVAVLAAMLTDLVVLPLFTQSATITITPQRQTVTTGGDIPIPATLLVHKATVLSEQVAATGTAHQPATAAHGLVTFYNALQSAQTIPAGTMLTSASGTNIVTDADAVIPGGTLRTNGSTTIAAHATVTGYGGNMPAGSINGPCCREYVFAYTSAFSGGQPARDYPTATAQDIAAATKDLTTLTTSQITAQAEALAPAGQAMTAPLCQSATASTPEPGAEAARITVSLTSDCTIYGYTRATLETQQTQLFNHALDEQFVLAGSIHSTITSNSYHGGTLVLSLTLTGEAVYRFQGSEIQAMQQLVRGKSRTAATAILLGLHGVQTVGIQIDNGRATMPDSADAIRIAIYDK
jgi:hypothetical protein